LAISKGFEVKESDTEHVSKFYHEASAIVDEWMFDNGHIFRGAICPEHPEFRGRRQLTTYRCTGCQRDTRNSSNSSNAWARKRIEQEMIDIGMASDPNVALKNKIKEISRAAGLVETPDGKWYDPKTGSKYSALHYYNHAQSVLRQERDLLNQSTTLRKTLPSGQSTQDIVTELQYEINEEEGLDFSVPERSWYNAETGETFPKEHGRDKAAALLKQRLRVFGTHKLPDRPERSREQVLLELRHQADQRDKQLDQPKNSDNARIAAKTSEERLQAKLEASKAMVEQREAKEKARIDAKLAKAKADAAVRAERFKKDPLSRMK